MSFLQIFCPANTARSGSLISVGRILAKARVAVKCQGTLCCLHLSFGKSRLRWVAQ